jgi:hypothetical protein
MKTFKHKEINEKICNKFNLTSYKLGKFTHFKREGEQEIGFIEQIGATKKYLQTLLISFFSFEQKEKNDDIVNFVVEQYKEQKKVIDTNKQGLNVCLEQRGTDINKATLI